jgi:predicted ester cyclase
MTPSGESTRELVLRMHAELMRTRDPDRVEDFFAHDFVSHNMPPDFPPGVEGVKRFFGMFREGLPDLDVTLDEIVAEGDRVVIATTTTGTHTGDLLGIAPTGRRVAVTGIDLVRIEEGKIIEHRGLTDTMGLLRQLTG